MAKIPSYLLSLAGEYRICSELNKRGVFATITYGNRKAVDVYAIGDRQNRALRIEVKTSQRANFTTLITQKRLATDPAAPDFWVLFQINVGKGGTFEERFFVLTHKEICQAQAKVNRAYGRQYRARHGKPYDFATGVDNVRVVDVERFENQWSKIVDAHGGLDR